MTVDRGIVNCDPAFFDSIALYSVLYQNRNPRDRRADLVCATPMDLRRHINTTNGTCGYIELAAEEEGAPPKN